MEDILSGQNLTFAKHLLATTKVQLTDPHYAVSGEGLELTVEVKKEDTFFTVKIGGITGVSMNRFDALGKSPLIRDFEVTGDKDGGVLTFFVHDAGTKDRTKHVHVQETSNKAERPSLVISEADKNNMHVVQTAFLNMDLFQKAISWTYLPGYGESPDFFVCKATPVDKFKSSFYTHVKAKANGAIKNIVVRTLPGRDPFVEIAIKSFEDAQDHDVVVNANGRRERAEDDADQIGAPPTKRVRTGDSGAGYFGS